MPIGDEAEPSWRCPACGYTSNSLLDVDEEFDLLLLTASGARIKLGDLTAEELTDLIPQQTSEHIRATLRGLAARRIGPSDNAAPSVAP